MLQSQYLDILARLDLKSNLYFLHPKTKSKMRLKSILLYLIMSSIVKKKTSVYYLPGKKLHRSLRERDTETETNQELKTSFPCRRLFESQDQTKIVLKLEEPYNKTLNKTQVNNKTLNVAFFLNIINSRGFI